MECLSPSMIALSETCHGTLGAVQTWVSSGHLLRHCRAEERIKMMSASAAELPSVGVVI